MASDALRDLKRLSATVLGEATSIEADLRKCKDCGGNLGDDGKCPKCDAQHEAKGSGLETVFELIRGEYGNMKMTGNEIVFNSIGAQDVPGILKKNGWLVNTNGVNDHPQQRWTAKHPDHGMVKFWFDKKTWRAEQIGNG